MTFNIPSAESSVFFMIAFVTVSLIWFVGPKKRRASSVWFGMTFLFLAAYAGLAHFVEAAWCAMAAAGGAVVAFIAGLIASRVQRRP